MVEASVADFARFEPMEPEEILDWVISQFWPDLAVVSSFGAEDVVMIHMAAKLNPRIRIITLDTGRLPQETYDVMDRIRDRYGVHVKVYFPQADTVEKITSEHGPNLFYQSAELRKLCCHVRKVEPLNRALAGVRAWITGLRRAQSITRGDIPKVGFDPARSGKIKINPLVDWSTSRVWEYIRFHQIPYNRLHDSGYPSIGCAPCTRAIQPGEDERSGRWWWEHPEAKECGLHIVPPSN